jgi:hypothetical protein
LVLLLVSVLMRAGFAQNPILVPALATTSGLSPSIAQVGSGPFTLTLKGPGFSAGSTARLGSTNLATTYVSTTTLTAIVLRPNVVGGSESKTMTVTIPSNAVSGPVFVKRRDLGLPVSHSSSQFPAQPRRGIATAIEPALPSVCRR